jgi:hypothetical protein
MKKDRKSETTQTNRLQRSYDVVYESEPPVFPV